MISGDEPTMDDAILILINPIQSLMPEDRKAGPESRPVLSSLIGLTDEGAFPGFVLSQGRDLVEPILFPRASIKLNEGMTSVGLVFVRRNDFGLAVFSNATMMPHFSGEWLIKGFVLHP
jgi:hypothetical protein